jgi:hypothetical protein
MDVTFFGYTRFYILGLYVTTFTIANIHYYQNFNYSAVGLKLCQSVTRRRGS